jgi:hypothetical protein
MITQLISWVVIGLVTAPAIVLLGVWIYLLWDLLFRNGIKGGEEPQVVIGLFFVNLVYWGGLLMAARAWGI